MNIIIRKYTEEDLPQMIQIWNEVVEDGIAFPQEELLDMTSGAAAYGRHGKGVFCRSDF